MLQRANEIEQQLINWRREFHMHPELGFREARTAARVAEVLRSLGYRVRTGVGRTGVVAERGEGQPVVALRADMDALPLQELNAVIAQLAEFTRFVNTTQPQILALLEQGRSTLDQGQDVLEAVKNNPLLRRGVPAKRPQQTTFQSYRDEDF